jgi:hypothetical protein
MNQSSLKKRKAVHTDIGDRGNGVRSAGITDSTFMAILQLTLPSIHLSLRMLHKTRKVPQKK